MEERQLDLVFKALAHAERRRILASLRKKPSQSLFEICVSSANEGGQALCRQMTSQHLDALERARLLEISWKGRTKVHSVALDILRRAVEAAFDHYL